MTKTSKYTPLKYEISGMRMQVHVLGPSCFFLIILLSTVFNIYISVYVFSLYFTIVRIVILIQFLINVIVFIIKPFSSLLVKGHKQYLLQKKIQNG